MENKENSVCKDETFAELFHSHGKSLRNFIFYKCGDNEQAEDIVQEAFVRLWNNCAKVPFEKAKSFLYTVSNNLFLNEVQHNKVVLEFEKFNQNDRTIQDPEYVLEEKEFKSKLENAIAALPEGQREVFLMSRIDKMSYKEIAATLEVSVKAVEKRMHKALVKMRSQIKGL